MHLQAPAYLSLENGRQEKRLYFHRRGKELLNSPGTFTAKALGKYGTTFSVKNTISTGNDCVLVQKCYHGRIGDIVAQL